MASYRLNDYFPLHMSESYSPDFHTNSFIPGEQIQHHNSFKDNHGKALHKPLIGFAGRKDEDHRVSAAGTIP